MAEAARNDLRTEKVIGFAIEVHRQLGPGLLESAYEECLCFELRHAGIRLDCGYRLDFVVEDRLILELKTVERLLPIHEAQMLTYMKLSGIGVGLLLNFNTPVLKDGLRRMLL